MKAQAPTLFQPLGHVHIKHRSLSPSLPPLLSRTLSLPPQSKYLHMSMPSPVRPFYFSISSFYTTTSSHPPTPAPSTATTTAGANKKVLAVCECQGENGHMNFVGAHGRWDKGRIISRQRPPAVCMHVIVCVRACVPECVCVCVHMFVCWCVRA